MLFPPFIHRWFYLVGLALIAVGLPMSKALVSIGGITLAVNFILEGDFKRRFQRLIQQPVPVLLSLVLLFHVIGLVWTSDLAFAMKDIRVKLPLLLFPIVIALSAPLSKKQFQIILGLFIATVTVTSFLSTWEFMQIKDDPSADFRALSLFTSHIRYSLMV